MGKGLDDESTTLRTFSSMVKALTTSEKSGGSRVEEGRYGDFGGRGPWSKVDYRFQFTGKEPSKEISISRTIYGPRSDPRPRIWSPPV